MSVSSSPTAKDSSEDPPTEKEAGQASEQNQEEDQKCDPAELIIQSAYADTKKLLENPTGILHTIASVVPLRNAVEEPPLDAQPETLYPMTVGYIHGTSTAIAANSSGRNDGGIQQSTFVGTSLLTPYRGHNALFRALERLEVLEKEEAELQLFSPLTTELTKIATGDCHYQTPKDAIETLEALSQSVPRRVCQHPFKKNDIVWVCRTCQADETCVLCHSCFKQSNHEGHDVAFYHAQAGGCCDCGDPDAWDPAGFCPHHGPASHQRCFNEDGKLGPLSGSVIQRVQGVVPATVDWMVENVARSAEEGHARTEVIQKMKHEEQQEGQRAFHVMSGNSLATSNLQDDQDSSAAALFSPSAAGTSRSRRGIYLATTDVFMSSQLSLPDSTSVKGNQKEQNLSYTERLGLSARRSGGLYLVLKSDDINSNPQIVDALRDLLGRSTLYTESILQKVVRALKQFGQLVVWGTMELVAELTPTQIRLWLDGDRVASGVFGAAMLQRANTLTSHGMFCSILTRQELEFEQRAVILLQWLTALARSCDPLCQKVAESISPDRHLVPLLKADFKLSTRVTKYWHSLLLTLLAVPAFKSHLAAAYCDTYQSVTSEYARGMGVLERSGYALSVQFLNRVTYVVDLVQRRDLLGKLGASLYQTLEVATAPSVQLAPTSDSLSSRVQRRLDPNHFVLTHRRYSPCISDLKCVLNVKGMPRLFASTSGTFMKDWIASLALGQMMDSQTWRDWSQGHVELESRGWVGAFNASISLGSLFERLLSWDDVDPSPIQDPASPFSKNLMKCVDLTFHVLVSGILVWQNLEIDTYEATSYTTSLEPYKRSSASLPFSTVSVKTGSILAFRALPMSQTTPFSFHLPLHRFVAACLREACLRETGIDDLRHQLTQHMPGDAQDNLFIGLMEFPLLVLSRAAQIRAGLWRRNGNGLNDQVLNYAEPPFCRAMRDADLLLVQFSMLGRTRNQTTDCRPDSDIGSCFLIHLMLHRFGLFDFCGLEKAPTADINRYLDEVQKGMYSAEKSSEEMGDDFLLPSTYSPARDCASCLLLLEEFLHTMIILCSELPPAPPNDKSDHTSQAKWRLRREVIHRLASGSKTHSELAEVHHVLSHWDNVYLSEEGKLVNPDDATGAALGSVLADVANRKVSRGKMEPDKWELSREAWELYDPSFYHINLRSHQTAAESRPSLPHHDKFRVQPKPFCPPPPPAHTSFARIRRDITSDSTMIAIIYRTLHMHIRDNKKNKEKLELRGAMAYVGDDRSETALARAVHLLTLGAYAWQDATADKTTWRNVGGGSIGSIFFDRSDDSSAPTAREWISAALLANPRTQQASEWYEGEENCLQLLRRLAMDGGYDGSFVAQDRAVQAGAAWLCEFAAIHNNDASRMVYHLEADADEHEKQETEIEKRKRIAREKAMERMKAQAAKFASMMQDEMDDNDESESHEKFEVESRNALPQRHVYRQGSFASGSSVASTTDSEKATPPSSDGGQVIFDASLVPSRLMKRRPQCIICSDDGIVETRARSKDEEGHRKSRRRRNDGGNALAFVSYAQASTVMKGGGGPPSSGNLDSAFSTVRRFVGAHLALCGHAIHSECWESYLATVSHREDRIVGKRDEFRCPLCQRLSNCLVPFIDVGIEWIDAATDTDSSMAMDVSKAKSEEGALDSMSCESMEMLGPLSLQSFLLSTPWWVSRHNDSIVWDGQCAFIPDPGKQENSSKAETDSPSEPSARRRRSVRALRKKDLYAAWNAMMKTPRFVRRKLKPTYEAGSVDPLCVSSGLESPVISLNSSSDSAGETVVWRRFMDQISDITYRADGKRLGDENLHSDFGEFRHYITEKYAYNMVNRYAGKEPTDWPSCVYPLALSDTKRQELSREKLLSKLMMSMQAFTYSTCCEANEARRVAKKIRWKHPPSNYAIVQPVSEGSEIESIFSKYGISNIVCDGKLVVMPRPNPHEDDGCQPFNGRLGRLRYFGLAVMAAAGAVAADLVQLVLSLPLQPTKNESVQPYRAPIVYPLLYGHVLTHVTAAICASTGRARARSDSLELAWPIPFSSRGSFMGADSFRMQKVVDSVVDDSEGFIKLGLLARVLQVLLGKFHMLGLNNISGHDTKRLLLKCLQRMRSNLSTNSSAESQWIKDCIILLKTALGGYHDLGEGHTDPHAENSIINRIQEGCLLAAEAACTFLSDIGIILQLLVPGIMQRYPAVDKIDNQSDSSTPFDTLRKLFTIFRIEPVSDMLESDTVRQVLLNWYETAIEHSNATKLPAVAISAGAAVTSRLYQTQGFRIHDWPMESCHDVAKMEIAVAKTEDFDASAKAEDIRRAKSMHIDLFDDDSFCQPNASLVEQQATSSLVTFSSKKSVDLIGGFTNEIPIGNNGRPRIAMLPTSYTDLYAELGQLLPESEQTAACLICGEVLNAGGKGECTRHSYRCGAGAGLFFLLQECAGLIMHNGKAAYIHSPYVDSHGETPQYRGRPLNLDLDRYDHLREVWSGHSIRQHVLAERGSSRQIIVPDFY